MTTLRVLVRAADPVDVESAWALYDGTDTRVAEGCAPAEAWPAADTLEFVVAAGDVRLVALPLPPMPAARMAAAAAFALEDQLAGPASDHWHAVAPERRGGRVVVAVVARSLVAALRARAAGAPQAGRLARVLAEPDLAATNDAWCWCVPSVAPSAAADSGSPEREGFVRLTDGSAFPVSATGADGTLPAELQLALARAGQADAAAPVVVRVDADASDAALAQWQQQAGVPFVRGEPWQWQQVGASAFASAINLLQREFAPTPELPAGSRLRAFVPAVALAAAALTVHIAGTVGEWAWWRLDAWRTARATVEAAISAGVPEAAATSAPAAVSALATRNADVRHARGLAAPDDALPLFARAAPALVGLPPGALKSASYAGGHWTLELTGIDAATRAELDARLRQSGTPAISAPTANGLRLRIGAL